MNDSKLYGTRVFFTWFFYRALFLQNIVKTKQLSAFRIIERHKNLCYYSLIIHPKVIKKFQAVSILELCLIYFVTPSDHCALAFSVECECWWSSLRQRPCLRIDIAKNTFLHNFKSYKFQTLAKDRPCCLCRGFLLQGRDSRFLTILWIGYRDQLLLAIYRRWRWGHLFSHFTKLARFIKATEKYCRISNIWKMSLMNLFTITMLFSPY